MPIAVIEFRIRSIKEAHSGQPFHVHHFYKSARWQWLADLKAKLFVLHIRLSGPGEFYENARLLENSDER